MTQKKLSLAWEIAMPPAPMANTARTFINSLSNPRGTNKGAITEAVVTMATVDEPWAVLRARDIRNGRRRPRLALLRLLLTRSAIPEFWSIFPNIPPAPVIRMIGAAVTRESPIQPVDESSFNSNFLGNQNDMPAPSKRAMMGLPINFRTDISLPSPNGCEG